MENQTPTPHIGAKYGEIAKTNNVTSKKVDNVIQAIKRKLKLLLKGE